MASAIAKIIKKEVIEMVRDPRLLAGMIIVPLLIFPLMGFAMSASVSSVEDSANNIDLGIVNLDGGNRSGELLSLLVSKGVNDSYYNYNDLELLLNDTEYPVNLFMVIPQNFTMTIDSNGSALVFLYTPLKTYSISESIPSDIVASYIIEYQNSVLDERISNAFPGQDVSTLRNPISVGSLSVIDGKVVQNSPSAIANQMMTQSLMVPMILMLLLVMAAQLAATSVAMEKEEKTLETLLTTPVPRSSILFGKIVGVVVISIIALVAYVFGFSFYMSSLNSMAEGGASIDLAAIGLAPSSLGMVILFVTLFLSLVSALSLSVLVASFTEDVRSAQALLGVLYVPIFIPALVLMFVDIGQLPAFAQGVILAIPFTYPVLAAKAMYTGEFMILLFGIVYQIIFTGIIIYIASWFFSSEKIFTVRLNLNKGGKFSLSKRNRPPRKSTFEKS
jgi:ABC-2 type transport system permease protein